MSDRLVSTGENLFVCRRALEGHYLLMLNHRHACASHNDWLHAQPARQPNARYLYYSLIWITISCNFGHGIGFWKVDDGIQGWEFG